LEIERKIMMKLKKDEFKRLQKETLSDISLCFSDDPLTSRIQLEDAIKVLALLYIQGNSNPKKHLMEATILGALNSCSNWIRDISNKEYPEERVYSKKKIDIKQFLE